MGATCALAVLGTDDLDPAALAVHIATITTFHDTLRTVEKQLPHLL
jgi:hypothetical protein